MTTVVQHPHRSRNTLIFGVIACTLIALTLSLAQWQVRRAHTKQAVQQAMLQQGKIPAVLIDALIPNNLLPFRRITVTGQWLPQYGVFLDNQVLNGRVGYHVLMPFKTQQGELLLVDRGWLAKTFEHDPSWPARLSPPQSVELQRVVWPAERPVLKQGLTIQGVSRSELGAVWGLSLHPSFWREQGHHETGLIRSWPVIGEDEINKHWSYAGQWLLFAFMILGAFGFYVWKQWFRPS